MIFFIFPKDTLNRKICTQDCDMLYYVAPLYFAFFVLSTQFVLVNVVVAVLMKQLEDSKEESLSGKSDSISEINNGNQDGQQDAHSEDRWRAYADEDRRSNPTDNEEYAKSEEGKINEDTHSQFDDPEMLGRNLAFSPEYLEFGDTWTKQETQETTDDVFECGYDNAIIVVSPVHGRESSVSLNTPSQDGRVSNELQGSHLNLKETEDTNHLTLKEPDEKDTDRSVSRSSRSMPDILCPPVDRTTAGSSASLSCLETEVAKRTASSSPSKYHKSDDELALFTRRRSSCRVAPLPDGLADQGSALSVRFNNQQEDRLAVRSVSTSNNSSISDLSIKDC